MSCAASSRIALACWIVGAQVTAGYFASWTIVQPFSSGREHGANVTASVIPEVCAFARWPLFLG